MVLAFLCACTVFLEQLLARNRMDLRKKAFDQPAKLADRVIAPGEAAEPGDREQSGPSP
jgi:hypothetical protein